MDLNELAPELATVFAFVAKTATAIRMHSAYNSSADLSSIESAVDVRWLSDALHNFDQFGAALEHGNAAHLAAACEFHASMFRTYMTVTRHPYAPLATFTRNSAIDLAGTVEALDRLRTKALAQAREARETGTGPFAIPELIVYNQ